MKQLHRANLTLTCMMYNYIQKNVERFFKYNE